MVASSRGAQLPTSISQQGETGAGANESGVLEAYDGAPTAATTVDPQMCQPLVSGCQEYCDPAEQLQKLPPELQARIRKVRDVADAETTAPIAHGRLCLVGIVFLACLRVAAWWQSIVPGSPVRGMHLLTTVSDVACLLFCVPLYTHGTTGRTVQFGCLGPVLTLVFAMAVVDSCALVAYLVAATPRPVAPGTKSLVDVAEACAGVWEFALLASVALQVSLSASTWRIYKTLRAHGLYPPDFNPAQVGNPQKVSVLEVVCEAEDVEMLSGCASSCCTSSTGETAGSLEFVRTTSTFSTSAGSAEGKEDTVLQREVTLGGTPRGGQEMKGNKMKSYPSSP